MRIAFIVALLSSACCSAKGVVAPEPLTRSDRELPLPDTAYWSRIGEGRWVYDLGVDLANDVQLVVEHPEGRGLVRVALPEGATAARIEAITAQYVGEGGAVVWHVHADDGGHPGAELGQVAATIADRDVVAIGAGAGGTGVRHAFTRAVEVPAVFWLSLEKTQGAPRVGGMFLKGEMTDVFSDLFYVAAPGAAPVPLHIRPFVRIELGDLGR